MFRMKHLYFGSLVAALSVAALAAGASAAAAAPISFEGKKIELWVPFDTGGGTDRFVRMFQPFLKKYLPGQPDVVVFNKPGGASVTATNLFHERAPKDGTTLLGVSISTLSGYVLGNEAVRFEPKEWKPLMTVPAGTAFYANPSTSGVVGKDIGTDIKALQKKTIKIGMQNPRSSDLRSYVGLRLLGINVDPILGLSKGEQRQAVVRGELDVGNDAISTFIKKDGPFIKQGKLAPLFCFGYGQDFGPDPVLTDMPTYIDAYKAVHGKAPSGIEWDGLRMILALSGEAAKSLVLPPDTPEDIVKVYDETIEKISKDEEFIKLAAIELSYPYYLGDEARAAIKRATSGTPEAKAWLQALLKKEFNIN